MAAGENCELGIAAAAAAAVEVVATRQLAIDPLYSCRQQIVRYTTFYFMVFWWALWPAKFVGYFFSWFGFVFLFELWNVSMPVAVRANCVQRSAGRKIL